MNLSFSIGKYRHTFIELAICDVICYGKNCKFDRIVKVSFSLNVQLFASPEIICIIMVTLDIAILAKNVHPAVCEKVLISTCAAQKIISTCQLPRNGTSV